MLSQYFSKNRKGDYFKCCDSCKEKKTNKFTPTSITINKARAEFIEQTMYLYNDKKIIYEGELDPALVDFPSEEFPKFKLNEYLLEYHLFRLIDSDTPIIIRWRLKFDENVSVPIHFETGPSVIK